MKTVELSVTMQDEVPDGESLSLIESDMKARLEQDWNVDVDEVEAEVVKENEDLDQYTDDGEGE